MAFQGFGKNSGPTTGTAIQQPVGSFSNSTSSAPSVPRSSSHVNPIQMIPGLKESPPLAFQSNSFNGNGPPFGESQLQSFPTRGNNLSKSLGTIVNRLSQPATSTMPGGKSPVKNVDIHVSKRSRSPTYQSGRNGPVDYADIASYDTERPLISEPKMRSNGSGCESHQEFLIPLHYDMGDVASSRTSFPVAKKTKLPSVSSSNQEHHDTPLLLEEESNRELDAKAKRLLRFKDELSHPLQSDLVSKTQMGTFKSQQSHLEERGEFIGDLPMQMKADSCRGSVLSDYEGMDSSSIIMGSCLDMCPESERAERQRKGDLDQYERVNGDRNQTSKSLAIKKYTRTAEREAELIRPMPILQKTMDYLLKLLNLPYDDTFLGLYNFLWDRMRAIRMDLRMQHIFSSKAITMLEQMIRLHIIAMHELCEYTKGEGFAEGFDAHLNIEQMNKTSVELFQLYDDHRKNGVHVVTEKEFRGYYALLKLDKHPGYKVEPAELSLDLAKMTPDMRQTPEVVFARAVARACRTGNFIAFFRLAQKASYLQACLMHAHFAKLRTQALAALHGGLQNNQGIPIAHVAKWLGMEEENIEDLLEYHGFSLKEFEVPYMVKAGPFLNVDSDYPVKRSGLVHRRRSGMIVQDVAYPCQAKPESLKERTVLPLDKSIQQKLAGSGSVMSVKAIFTEDKEMPDYIMSPKTDGRMIPMHRAATDQVSVLRGQPSPPVSSALNSFFVHDSGKSLESRLESVGKAKYESHFRNSLDRNLQVDLKEAVPFVVSGQMGFESSGMAKYDNRFRNSLDRHLQVDGKEAAPLVSEQRLASSPDPAIESVQQNSVPQHLFEDRKEDILVIDREASGDEAASTSNNEVFEAKLKLVLRIWKRLSLKKRALREQRKFLADAALTSLPLGLPICRPEIQPSPSSDFNIDGLMSNRSANLEKSWAKLNVAEVVSDILEGKNPDSKCLCWKLLLCVEKEAYNGDNSLDKKEDTELAASSWLVSKLVPRSGDHDFCGDLTFSSPGMSIWKKWLSSCSGNEPTCCLTVVRETNSVSLNEVVPGASAILFFLFGHICWESEKKRLQNVLMALPYGSRLPLLLLCGSLRNYLDRSTVIQEMRLSDIDRSRISSFNVVFLNNLQVGQLNVFLDNDLLKEGLQWLARESSPQPVLSWIRTRELVLLDLNPSLYVLNDMDGHGEGPNSCITAFNEALDQSLAKIIAAAQANPTSWPCPEIALLEQNSDEYRAVSYYLPRPGWSLASRIEPLMHALNACKLPQFGDDLRWLYRGANRGNGLQNQRLKLESILINYFTELSQMMALPLAKKEASLILQKFVRLELQNSTYYIKPEWVLIFRRIFNWRLMGLSYGEFSSAYILKDNVTMSNTALSNLTKSSIPPPPLCLVQPSLDEMVEVGQSVEDAELLDSDDVAGHASSNVHETSKIIITHDNMEEDEGVVEENGDLVSCIPNDGNEYVFATSVRKQEDRLSALFERCNIVQDMIQEKLSIYF